MDRAHPRMNRAYIYIVHFGEFITPNISKTAENLALKIKYYFLLIFKASVYK